jgi:hypothetical protein
MPSPTRFNRIDVDKDITAAQLDLSVENSSVLSRAGAQQIVVGDTGDADDITDACRELTSGGTVLLTGARYVGNIPATVLDGVTLHGAGGTFNNINDAISGKDDTIGTVIEHDPSASGDGAVYWDGGEDADGPLRAVFEPQAVNVTFDGADAGHAFAAPMFNSHFQRCQFRNEGSGFRALWRQGTANDSVDNNSTYKCVFRSGSGDGLVSGLSESQFKSAGAQFDVNPFIGGRPGHAAFYRGDNCHLIAPQIFNCGTDGASAQVRFNGPKARLIGGQIDSTATDVVGCRVFGGAEQFGHQFLGVTFNDEAAIHLELDNGSDGIEGVRVAYCNFFSGLSSGAGDSDRGIVAVENGNTFGECRLTENTFRGTYTTATTDLDAGANVTEVNSIVL